MSCGKLCTHYRCDDLHELSLRNIYGHFGKHNLRRLYCMRTWELSFRLRNLDERSSVHVLPCRYLDNIDKRESR